MMDRGECVKNVLEFHDSSSFLTSAINFPKVRLQSRKEYNVTYSYITHSITHIYTKNSITHSSTIRSTQWANTIANGV